MSGNTQAWLLAFSSGMVLGALFFGGLWWTVRRGMLSAVPAVWFSASLLIRTALAVGGFYAVSHGEWRRLLACLLGFLAARAALLWLSGARFAAPARRLKAAP
jgi:F1F0 ATPase subunit 2